MGFSVLSSDCQKRRLSSILDLRNFQSRWSRNLDLIIGPTFRRLVDCIVGVIYYSISKCFPVLLSAFKCFPVLPSPSRRLQVLLGTSKCFLVLPRASSCCQMLPKASKDFLVLLSTYKHWEAFGISWKHLKGLGSTLSTRKLWELVESPLKY